MPSATGLERPSFTRRSLIPVTGLLQSVWNSASCYHTLGLIESLWQQTQTQTPPLQLINFKIVQLVLSHWNWTCRIVAGVGITMVLLSGNCTQQRRHYWEIGDKLRREKYVPVCSEMLQQFSQVTSQNCILAWSRNKMLLNCLHERILEIDNLNIILELVDSSVVTLNGRSQKWQFEVSQYTQIEALFVDVVLMTCGNHVAWLVLLALLFFLLCKCKVLFWQ